MSLSMHALFHPLVVGLLLISACQVAASDADPVDFARDVFPILQRECFECHGAEKQEGDLRFDQARFAFRDDRVIAPGDAAKSELLRRINLPQGDPEIMPSRGAPLSDEEIGKITAWITSGAVWPADLQPVRHWSYVAPQRATLPEVPTETGSIRSPIDVWIADKLQQAGLKFSEPADRATLLRRVSLDLIGLPPSPAEIDAFLQDDSSDAYERVVDRLLASPQYGVRWARPWLDAARYADSHGFQRDDFRDLWPYRDWVVSALNDDMPFTQFTIEQLAGDLLPDATESQIVATGFNRSAPTNVEAGSDPEETRVNQVHDRVNTLGMVWLGTTLECAQCHDHKYDPISQRDYYGLFAFFNNTALEADRTNPKVPGSIQFQGPAMDLADAETDAERNRLRKQLQATQKRIDELTRTAQADLSTWEARLRSQGKQETQWQVLPISSFESLEGATHKILADQSVLLGGEPPPERDTYVLRLRTSLVGIRGIKLEALTDDSLPGEGPGRGDETRPNFVLNNLIATSVSISDTSSRRPLKFQGAKASFSQSNFPVDNLLKTDNDSRGGWAINPRFHEPHWVILTTAEPVGDADGTDLEIRLEQNFGGARTLGRIRLSATTGNPSAQELPKELRAALDVEPSLRDAKQQQVILDARLAEQPEYAAVQQEKNRLTQELAAIQPPSTLVMREDTPRASTMFLRGDFRSPGESVTPSTPQVWPALDIEEDRLPTRLDLARWLVRRDNPLVARVLVNRLWGELFGTGLVSTPEDFGMKGERPTHPELLDWLACEFMDNGWSQKDILKTIVMSTAYRQSSRVTPALFARDDRNRWYARGPRHRLEAELIRDNALAIAGLLNPNLGGPPIRPPQPDGLWVKVGGQRYDYEVSAGGEQYRRGLFVVWKRAAPYPSFVNFDANNRMACRVNRPRSNTPLQALVLMNDPVYVEAALAFARRVLTELPQADDSERIQYAFRIATSRIPRSEELAILTRLLDEERTVRREDPRGTREFLGAFVAPVGTTDAELAAWYAVTAALLNLDETISKE